MTARTSFDCRTSFTVPLVSVPVFTVIVTG